MGTGDQIKMTEKTVFPLSPADLKSIDRIVGQMFKLRTEMREKNQPVAQLSIAITGLCKLIDESESPTLEVARE